VVNISHIRADHRRRLHGGDGAIAPTAKKSGVAGPDPLGELIALPKPLLDLRGKGKDKRRGKTGGEGDRGARSEERRDERSYKRKRKGRG